MAGIKTTVTDLIIPSSARQSSAVSVQMKVKNTTYSPLLVMVRVVLEYGVSPWPVAFDTELQAIPAGETQIYSGSFIMPQASVVVHAYSYYYNDATGSWHPDDLDAAGSVLVEAAPSMLEMMMPIMALAIMVPIMMKMMPEDEELR